MVAPDHEVFSQEQALKFVQSHHIADDEVTWAITAVLGGTTGERAFFVQNLLVQVHNPP